MVNHNNNAKKPVLTEVSAARPQFATRRPGSFLSESLQPKNWAALADRRTPWPEDLDPKQALKELAVFMEYRMIEDGLQSQGRSIDMLIQQNEGRY